MIVKFFRAAKVTVLVAPLLAGLTWSAAEAQLLAEALHSPVTRIAMQRIGRALLNTEAGNTTIGSIIGRAIASGDARTQPAGRFLGWLRQSSTAGLTEEQAGQLVFQVFEDAAQGREVFHPVRLFPGAGMVELTPAMRSTICEIGEALLPQVRQVVQSDARFAAERARLHLEPILPETRALSNADFGRLQIELRTVDRLRAAFSQLQLEVIASAATRLESREATLLAGGRVVASTGVDTGAVGAAARSARAAHLERELGIPGIAELGDTRAAVRARLDELAPLNRQLSRSLRSAIARDAATAQRIIRARGQMATRFTGEQRMDQWLRRRPAVVRMLRELGPTARQNGAAVAGQADETLLSQLGEQQFGRVYDIGSRHYGAALYFQSKISDMGVFAMNRLAPRNLMDWAARRPEFFRDALDELMAGGVVQMAAQALQFGDTSGAIDRALHPDETIARNRVNQALDQWFAPERWQMVKRSLLIIECVNMTIVWAMIPKPYVSLENAQVVRFLADTPAAASNPIRRGMNLVSHRFKSFVQVGAVSGFAGTLFSEALDGNAQSILTADGATMYSIEMAKTAAYLGLWSLLRYSARSVVLGGVASWRVAGGAETFISANPGAYSLIDAGSRFFNNSIGSYSWVRWWSPAWEVAEARLRSELTTHGVLSAPAGPLDHGIELPQ